MVTEHIRYQVTIPKVSIVLEAAGATFLADTSGKAGQVTIPCEREPVHLSRAQWPEETSLIGMNKIFLHF